MEQMDDSDIGLGLGLGIDAGGTQTRWALARADGVVLAEGHVAGLSALQLASAAGRVAVQATFAELAAAVLAHGRPRRVRAGLTGYGAGSDGSQLQAWLAALFALDGAAVTISSDIAIAYLDQYAPGQGYLVYAGTGSIGAYLDLDHVLHRAGGRGVLLDDGGGGYWIAREALRLIWRREDEAPGAWQQSAMARDVFAHIGGHDWDSSRQFMYGQQRGAIGRLALAVAASADQDADALAILVGAGVELARLARALTDRFGPRPVALAGRAASLHPAIFASMRAALPESIELTHATGQAHHAAARLATHDVTHP